jgi:MFS family permease
LLPIGLGTTLSLLGDTAIYTVLPTHAAEAGVTLASVGILLSANRWIRLLLNGPAGMVYDRWRRRPLFVPALFLGAFSTLLFALGRGFWPLLLSRLLWGVAWSGIWVGGNTIILDVTDESDRGRWTGLYQLSFYLGGTLGFPLGGLLTDWLGFQAALLVAAGATALGAVIALAVLPETHRPRPTPPVVASEQADPPTDAAEAAPASNGGARAALASATALYGANRFVVAGMISATLGLLLKQAWGEDLQVASLTVGVATLTGLMLGLSTLTSMLAAPIAGHWSDRLGSRWGVAAGGLAAGAVGLGILAAGLPAIIAVGVILTAIAGSSNQSLATAIVGDLADPARRSRSLGWMHTFGDLTSAIAPPLAYALLPWLGLPGLYLFCAVLLVGLAAWVLRGGRARDATQRRKEKPNAKTPRRRGAGENY